MWRGGERSLTAMARTLLALASAGLAAAFASSGSTPPFCDRDADSPAAAAALAAAADELLVGEGKPFARVARGTARLALSQDRGGTDFDESRRAVHDVHDRRRRRPPRRHVPHHPEDRARSASPGLARGPQTAMFVLGPADAVAFYGCTPPPVAYFGFDAILETRLATWYGVARDERRPQHILGTNFVDALNHRAINVSDADGAGATIRRSIARRSSSTRPTARRARRARRLRGRGRAPRGVQHARARRVGAAAERPLGRERRQLGAIAPDVLFTLLRASVPAPPTAAARPRGPARLYLAATPNARASA